MKAKLKYLIPIIVLLVFIASSVYADAPPDPGGGPAGGAGPVGGGAPVGGGIFTLFILSMMYGVKKALALIKK